MKWILIIVISSWTHSQSSNVVIEKFPTLAECHETGKRAQEQFTTTMGPHSLLNFTCAPSIPTEPICGLDDQEPCQ